jgi:hypothetical protein
MRFGTSLFAALVLAGALANAARAQPTGVSTTAPGPYSVYGSGLTFRPASSYTGPYSDRGPGPELPTGIELHGTLFHPLPLGLQPRSDAHQLRLLIADGRVDNPDRERKGPGRRCDSAGRRASAFCRRWAWRQALSLRAHQHRGQRHPVHCDPVTRSGQRWRGRFGGRREGSRTVRCT